MKSLRITHQDWSSDVFDGLLVQLTGLQPYYWLDNCIKNSPDVQSRQWISLEDNPTLRTALPILNMKKKQMFKHHSPFWSISGVNIALVPTLYSIWKVIILMQRVGFFCYCLISAFWNQPSPAGGGTLHAHRAVTHQSHDRPPCSMPCVTLIFDSNNNNNKKKNTIVLRACSPPGVFSGYRGFLP